LECPFPLYIERVLVNFTWVATWEHVCLEEKGLNPVVYVLKLVAKGERETETGP
jgi:hypothetical protein